MPLPLPHVKELRRSLSENGMYITAFPFTFNHHNYIVLFEDLRQLNEGSTYYGARITFIDEQDNQRILRVQVNANGFDAANSVIFDYFEINANGQSGRALQMLFDALNHSTPAQYTQISEIYKEEVLRSIQERDKEEGYCCYKTRSNGKKADGNQIYRTPENTAKTILLRPSLYNLIGKEHPEISFCYRKENELSDTEILRNSKFFQSSTGTK